MAGPSWTPDDRAIASFSRFPANLKHVASGHTYAKRLDDNFLGGCVENVILADLPIDRIGVAIFSRAALDRHQGGGPDRPSQRRHWMEFRKHRKVTLPD